ncbi:hypothetical protein SDC9_93285 [bioreactor metagenome]|uniref:Uncharacterized protein n=1 Tax=bioreactor metagenome TaxID=1076179 RepID=A0A645A2U6_9ZZZZ
MPRLAGNRAAGHVTDRHRVAAELFRFAQRRNGVRGLTTLADNKERFALVNQMVAIAVFARNIHIHAEFGHVLNELFTKHPRMKGCSATHDGDAAHVSCPRFIPGEAIGFEREVFMIHILIESLAESIRLFADFLHHEVFVVAFFCGLNVPVHVHRCFLDFYAELVIILDAALVQNRHLAVLQEADIPRVF